MNSLLLFWMIFIGLSLIIFFLSYKYDMLKDESTALKKPFSFSRVQMTWWTVIVLSSFISIILKKCAIPSLSESTLVLLGISSATLATSRIIDVSDSSSSSTGLSRNAEGQNFFLDILSDNSGISIHRFQTVMFNIVFGGWFIHSVLKNLDGDPCSIFVGDALKTCLQNPENYIMPVISPNNLILLGLSSATYAALKTTENKNTAPPAAPNNPPVAANPAVPINPAAPVNPPAGS